MSLPTPPRRWLLTLALAATLAVALAGPAASQHPGGGGHAGQPPASATNRVSIGFDAVKPPTLDIIRGESVTWTNESARVHTVTADDDGFDSGRLARGYTFTHQFKDNGEIPYHCTLHPTITGVVAVHELLLETPAQAAAPKRPFPISGRSSLEPGTEVAIEADSGTGFARVAAATVTFDGDFSAQIVPETTARYRAVAGDKQSEAVELPVLDHRITLSVRRQRGRVRLQARVTPATSKGRIVLQIFLPQHFGWWPVQTAKLGKRSAASFTLHPRGRVRARVRYTLPDGATALATSRAVTVGTARTRRR